MGGGSSSASAFLDFLPFAPACFVVFFLLAAWRRLRILHRVRVLTRYSIRARYSSFDGIEVGGGHER